jgi:hypothetical protein
MKITCARARRRNRLIGALATGSGEELATQHGFAGARQPIDTDDHVGIRTADDHDCSVAFHVRSAIAATRRP